jgi:arsenite-transporting ATPase
VRTLLFTGPGGTGTTTLAAAAAVRTARAGRRTVLLTRQEAPVPGLDAVEGLRVIRVAGQASLERLWGAHVDALAAVLPQLTLPPTSSVVAPPGAGDLAVLAELAGAEADVVVLDGGPLSSAMELLRLPAALRWWLDQLLTPRVRALGAVRTAAVASGVVRRGPVDAAWRAVPALEALLGRLPLGDPAATAVYLVAEPRHGAAAALRTAATALALQGQEVAGILARALPAEATAGEWWSGRTAEQESVMAELAGIGPVRQVAVVAVAPHDVASLVALLPDLDDVDARDPAPPSGTVAVAGPERVDGGWRLTVPLPFAERTEVELTRWADDLVLTVAGARRSVRLDALLRRCAVTGGRLAEPGTASAHLEVTFVPDPQLWPADLLAADGSSS